MVQHEASSIPLRSSSSTARLTIFEVIVCVYYCFSYVFRICSYFAVFVSCCFPGPSRFVGWTLQQIALRFYAFWMARGYVHEDLIPHEFGPSISFAGGGMLWPYYLGVAHHVFETYDASKIKVLASSCGCFGAIPLVMGEDPYIWCRSDWPSCIAHFESRSLGTFFDSLDFYYNLWDQYLPPDAHIRATGRLHLSITLFPSFRNCVVTQFSTRQELINCIVASICLPIIFMRSFPRTQFGLSVDGGLTNDQPCMDRYTITCSVLNEKADIFPSTRASPLDIIRVPSLEQVFNMAERASQEAANSRAFSARREWVLLRREFSSHREQRSATIG